MKITKDQVKNSYYPSKVLSSVTGESWIFIISILVIISFLLFRFILPMISLGLFSAK